MGHIDPRQPPSKGKPWTALAGLDFIYQIDLIFPEDIGEVIRQKLIEDRPSPRYSRVTMPLLDVLQGSFFTEYIKHRPIQMLSSGRKGIEDVFMIIDGKLTMYLEKESYERAGVVGQPYGVKGKRGLKPRWVVQYDLQAHAAFPGKKGYDRLLYAAKNVFNEPLTWLLCDLSTNAPDPDPLAAHNATPCTAQPTFSSHVEATLPSLQIPAKLLSSEHTTDFELFATDLYEWLSLIRLESPRIRAGDSIDPYLSRYRIPGNPDWEQQQTAKVSKITWRGFLSPAWAKKLLIDALVAVRSKSWVAFSATTFAQGLTSDAREFVFLRPPETPDEYLVWVVKGHE